MKVTIEMDQIETRKAIANGTFAALCEGLPTGNQPAIHPLAQGTSAPQEDGAAAKALAKVKADQEAAAAAEADRAAKEAAAAKKAAAKAKADAAAKAAADAAAEAAKAAAEAEGEGEDEATPTGNTPPWGGEAAGATDTEYTIEAVRTKLAALNKAGKSASVKALLGEFGAAKLTEVDEASYPALMAKAATL